MTPSEIFRFTALSRQLACSVALVASSLSVLAPAPAGAQQTTVASGPGPAGGSLTDQVIHDYLRRHPEAVLEALQAAEAQRQSTEEAEARSQILSHGGELAATQADAIAGNPAGSITLIEFFDYQCPYCKTMAPTIAHAIYGNAELRVVYKDIPILGPASLLAGRAALASRAQNKFVAFHDALLTVKGPLSEATIMTTAASVGLDADRLKRDMADPAIDAALKRNLDLARELKIRGTPAIIVGGTLAPGALDLGDLQALIEQARKG